MPDYRYEKTAAANYLGTTWDKILDINIRHRYPQGIVANVLVKIDDQPENLKKACALALGMPEEVILGAEMAVSGEALAQVLVFDETDSFGVQMFFATYNSPGKVGQMVRPSFVGVKPLSGNEEHAFTDTEPRKVVEIIFDRNAKDYHVWRVRVEGNPELFGASSFEWRARR